MNTIFQTTAMKSSEWITDLMQALGITDEHKALRALRAALHTIRDHVPTAEAVALGAQLPMLLRGLYYEGWRPVEKPPRLHTHAELVAVVERHLSHDSSLDADTVLHQVMRLLHGRVSTGELRHLALTTSRPLASMWDTVLGGAS